MRRILLFQFIVIFLSGALFAQTSGVTGKVSAPDGSGLPGVSVFLKGTSTGTITDAGGRYAIQATSGTLIFTAIGYKPLELSIPAAGSADALATLDVILEEDITALDELVVIGYGTQQKKDITGAVAVIDKEAIASRPNSQFGNLIQGKTAGVQVLSSSGKPSAGFNIRIRGTSSIDGSSEPLYVVDGIVSTDTRLLNPADIESITILKDASSAAIYGAQGANGVVLITTKQGTTAAPKFELSAYGGVQTAWKKIKVLNSEQYRDLMTEMGYATDWSRYTANTDWQNKIFQNGTSQNYQLSVSGKNDKTAYYMSAGWTQQIGTVRSAEMDRYNFKVNLNQYVNDWLKLGTNINYARYHDVDVSDNTNVNSGGVILGMLTTPPNIDVLNEDGTYTSNPFQDWENPVSGTDAADRDYRSQRLLGNIFTEINLMPDLTFKSSLGIDYIFGIYDYFLDPFSTSYGRANEGIGQNTTSLTNYYIFDNTLTYRKVINNHSFSLLIGSVVQKYKWENNSITATGYSGTSVTTTNAGSNVTANNTKSEKSNASFISRLTYDYQGKYLLTANFRADGSSAFGPNKRWGYFPSASVGWRISQEDFFPEIDNIVNDVKLRLGWGLTGNDMSAYAYLGLVNSGSNYLLGSEQQPGTYPSSIQNDDLKWEATEQTNIGIDIALLASRITFSADAYLKNTHDLLMSVPVPTSTGFSSGLQNVGEIQNKGLEFLVSSQNLTGDLTWQTDFNISFNRNKVVNILGNQLATGDVASRGNAVLNVEGKPLGMFYGYVWGGVDPATGKAYYIDSNNESVFEPSADTDRRFIGNPNPDFTYGLTNTLSYKNFSLSIFLQGVQGNDVLNATRIETESMTSSKNQSAAVLKRWRQPGDVTDIPGVSTTTYNSLLSTRFVEDGSYLRVKALTLGYAFPAAWLSKVHVSSAKLYVTGENLFTFTQYSGYDPEVNAYGGSNTVQGIDYGTYPQTRNIICGINITF